MSAVAKRYARAVFEVAQERGLVDQIEQDLVLVSNAVLENKGISKILNHPQVSKESKKDLVSQIFQNAVSAETLNFLHLLLDNDRQNLLSSIVRFYTAIANEARGIADAIVTTAKPLSAEEESKIAEQFGKQIQKKLRIQTVVDPSILGGVIVKIGDRLYDGSIKSKLEQFAHGG
jgi:F-type H+-transporting ATPase subunit delta